MNLLAIYLVSLVIFIGLFYTVYRLLNKKSRSIQLLGQAIILALFVVLFPSIFVSEYPNPKMTYSVENEMVREYNPEDSYTIYEIDKWIKVDKVGWVYLNRIDTVDDKQLRLFYRSPGMLLGINLNLDMVLSDNNDNVFSDDASSIHSALIVSSGILDFIGNDEGKSLGDDFVLSIEGKEYSFH